MSWLAEIVKSTSCHVKCCFSVSVIVGLKLSERGLIFFSILSFVSFAVVGQLESSQKKKLRFLGYGFFYFGMDLIAKS